MCPGKLLRVHQIDTFVVSFESRATCLLKQRTAASAPTASAPTTASTASAPTTASTASAPTTASASATAAGAHRRSCPHETECQNRDVACDKVLRNFH